MGQPPLRGVGEEQAKDDRLHVQMQMPVYMIEREARGVEGAELRGDFAVELVAQAPLEKVAAAEANGVAAKLAAGIHEIGNLRTGKGGRPENEREMQTNGQPRILARQAHRFGRGGLI